MVDGILIFWLLIFIVFLIVNIAGNSKVFGIIDGCWLLILGLAVIATGIQLQSGVNVTVVGGIQNVAYTYSDVVLPFSTYSYVWGIFFMAISIYMIYVNAEKL